MKCDIYIMPEKSGKTTRVIEEFLKDPYNTYIMTQNVYSSNNIIRTIKENYPEQSKKLTGALFRRQIKTNDSISLRGYDVKKIILDDYLLWTTHEKEMFNLNFGSSISLETEIIVYTSNDKLYNKNLFLLIKDLKEKYHNIYEIANSLPQRELREHALELYNSLLTSKNVSIYCSDNIYKIDLEPNIINSSEVFLEKIKTFGSNQVSLNFSISEDILEEYFEEINWNFYLFFNEVSSSFVSKFKKALEQRSVYNPNVKIINKNIKNNGKLFFIE